MRDQNTPNLKVGGFWLRGAPWGFVRDSAGLRGWGAHGAPQGPEGLRGALQGFVAWNCLSFDRQGEMAITGTLVWGIVHDGLFIDRQREKGLSLPRPPWRPRFEHVEASGGVFPG